MSTDRKTDLRDRILRGNTLCYPYDQVPVDNAVILFNPAKPYDFVLCATPHYLNLDIDRPLKDHPIHEETFKLLLRNKTGDLPSYLNPAHLSLSPKSQTELVRMLNDYREAFLIDRGTELKALSIPIDTIRDGQAIAQAATQDPKLLGSPNERGLLALDHSYLRFDYPNPRIITFRDFGNVVAMEFSVNPKTPKAQIYSITDGERKDMGRMELTAAGDMFYTDDVQDFLSASLTKKILHASERNMLLAKVPEANTIKTPNLWTNKLLLKQAHALLTDTNYRVAWMVSQDELYEELKHEPQPFDPFEL